MNTKSIRFKITSWYFITLLISTLLVFIGFYLVTERIIFSQVDKELTTHASKIAEIITKEGLNASETTLKGQLASEFSDIPGMVVVILDKDGNIIQSSFTSPDSTNTYKNLYGKIQNTKTTIFTNATLGNSPMRFTGLSLESGNHLLGVILVAHPIDVIQKSLNVLFAALGLIFVILTIPMIISGRFLAGKIMEPILVINRKLENITSQHLNERIINPKTNDEIEMLATSFNSLLDRLEKAFERERQFIGDVAHELKTPLATLQGGVELTLSRERSTNEYKQSLRETLLDSKRISTIIKNILDLAWTGAENNALETNFNLSKCLFDISDTAKALAFQKKINLKVKIEPNIIIFGNENKIQRAVLNLIDNAVKYTLEEGFVSLKLSKKSGRALIEVEDTGIGIPKSELPHVFDRFYRGSKTDKALGSGLGLAITKGIIMAHQGEINIKSKVGEGTVIAICLPLVS